MTLNQEQAQAYLSGAEPYADRDAYPIPQLILLDLDLPQKSGFEVLKWLKVEACFKQIPVIVLASSADSSDVDRAYALGANCCLLKTVNEEELKDIARGIGDYAALLKIRLSRGPELRRIHPPEEEARPKHNPDASILTTC
jgi:CheY-like chemotaxis protein